MQSWGKAVWGNWKWVVFAKLLKTSVYVEGREKWGFGVWSEAEEAKSEVFEFKGRRGIEWVEEGVVGECGKKKE